MRCSICKRSADDKLCKYHQLAYDKIKDNYEVWRRAYENLGYNEYLERLLESRESGEFIKDVARWELSLFKDEES